jgi:broad specificity phosphatase PhoE
MTRLFLLLSLLFGVFISATEAESTIFVVRHAEKAEGGGNDPDLSEAGRNRAETLARILKGADITAIYVTDLKRTQQTAEPLAKTLGINLTILRAQDSAALVAKLREFKGNALVVGHGNTIPDVIKGLGVANPVDISENDYDNLFVLTLDTKPRLLRLHYP